MHSPFGIDNKSAMYTQLYCQCLDHVFLYVLHNYLMAAKIVKELNNVWLICCLRFYRSPKHCAQSHQSYLVAWFA